MCIWCTIARSQVPPGPYCRQCWRKLYRNKNKNKKGK